MPFAIFLIMRLLLITSIVFIIGYVFGNFSKSVILTRFTKISSIFIAIAFVASSFFFFRFGGWRHENFNHKDRFECWQQQQDSTLKK